MKRFSWQACSVESGTGTIYKGMPAVAFRGFRVGKAGLSFRQLPVQLRPADAILPGGADGGGAHCAGGVQVDFGGQAAAGVTLVFGEDGAGVVAELGVAGQRVGAGLGAFGHEDGYDVVDGADAGEAGAGEVAAAARRPEDGLRAGEHQATRHFDEAAVKADHHSETAQAGVDQPERAAGHQKGRLVEGMAGVVGVQVRLPHDLRRPPRFDQRPGVIHLPRHVRPLREAPAEDDIQFLYQCLKRGKGEAASVFRPRRQIGGSIAGGEELRQQHQVGGHVGANDVRRPRHVAGDVATDRIEVDGEDAHGMAPITPVYTCERIPALQDHIRWQPVPALS